MTVDEFIERYLDGVTVYPWQREIIECVVNDVPMKVLPPARSGGWVLLGEAVNKFYLDRDFDRDFDRGT